MCGGFGIGTVLEREMLTGLCSVGGIGVSWAKSGRLGSKPMPSVATSLADFLGDCCREFIKLLLYHNSGPFIPLSLSHADVCGNQRLGSFVLLGTSRSSICFQDHGSNDIAPT